MATSFGIKPYEREKAVNYAFKWALQSNSQFYDFSNLGGDCTNFASQVIYAGARVMNFTPIYGWYYINANEKSPSWTGVNFLHQFLVNNRSKGPFAEEVEAKDIQMGDIIQLSFKGSNDFQHSLVVTKINGPTTNNIYISTHSPHALNEKLISYTWINIRFIHIKGVYV